MNKNNETGGPAFPVAAETSAAHEAAFQGMTLRDYFAAKAMQGMITKGMDNSAMRNKNGVPFISKFAYEYADGMLEARK